MNGIVYHLKDKPLVELMSHKIYQELRRCYSEMFQLLFNYIHCKFIETFDTL